MDIRFHGVEPARKTSGIFPFNRISKSLRRNTLCVHGLLTAYTRSLISLSISILQVNTRENLVNFNIRACSSTLNEIQIFRTHECRYGRVPRVNNCVSVKQFNCA